MEMIEKYIYAVTSRLPQSQREEIGKELRGLIHDMLEERGDEEVKEVLLELGSPREMADQYRGTGRYLISPTLFQHYTSVLKIVLGSILIALCTVFIVETILEPVRIIHHLFGLMGSIFGVCLQTFAWITIVFAFLEYKQVIPEDMKRGQNKAWKPEDLPPIPTKQKKIKRGEVLTGLIFSIVILIAFVSSTEFLGVPVFKEDELKGIAYFLNRDTYENFLPAIYLIVGLSIAKESMKLIIGRWTGKLAVLILIMNVITLMTGLFLLRDGAIWNPSFVEELYSLNEWNVMEASRGEIHAIWVQAKEWVRIGFVLTLLIETVSALYKGFKKE
ncbi:HAAS signaling domain-containing protein [Bacillus sp. KH172YL63]|uniref:HAAS signaling domain-containing protein n=1 Tax=Bacillus sp. KH172YL63 TaxID=2709784 RepID=UPI0013E4CB6E|nr:hypothetical protein [Bacillus sp. KH172YL63]BCB03620.1 hypothetical protein KH172YL63_17530 [Bacillus sp. KH172YL63]